MRCCWFPSGAPKRLKRSFHFWKTCCVERMCRASGCSRSLSNYQQLGGVSPINEQNRNLRAAIEADFADSGIDMPVYWGNRNWHPLLPHTLQQMAEDGIERALAFFTSAFSSYSGCRQYHEDIARARQQVGDAAPHVDKLRMFFNHPSFIEPMIENTRAATGELSESIRSSARLLFTAHSIPLSMAENCRYELQLRETCRLVAEGLGCDNWELVYQSRSGPPHQPWLEPDVCDAIRARHVAGDLSAAGRSADRVRIGSHGSTLRSRY